MANGMSQHEVVVSAIQDLVLRGDLAPGDRLPVEADLAARLGVSRGSLREGVRALVAMGVLETRQGSGTRVTSLDPQLLLRPLVFWASIQAGPSALNVHLVRRALEVEAAGQAAATIGGDDLERLAGLLADARPQIAAHDHEAALRSDHAFHRAVAEATGNPILTALVDALGRPTVRSRLWQSVHRAGRIESAHREHEAILDTLRRHDPVGARAAMYTHLSEVLTHLEAQEPDDGPGTAPGAAL
ncbi:MAG TPA: FadR/GntR family transcriptional regulator [Propionibacteriaceae bacterium]|nr:FadR/GntR family transcriptional regulator [Propionibacteriaceae bacterium]